MSASVGEWKTLMILFVSLTSVDGVERYEGYWILTGKTSGLIWSVIITEFACNCWEESEDSRSSGRDSNRAPSGTTSCLSWYTSLLTVINHYDLCGSWPQGCEISIQQNLERARSFVYTVVGTGIENTCYGCQQLPLRHIRDLCLFAITMLSSYHVERLWTHVLLTGPIHLALRVGDLNLCLSTVSSHWTGLSEKGLIDWFISPSVRTLQIWKQS
jgi:hypothetical protein